MPVEPGRFLSSRGASSEQQVNAGWQGPRLCNNYATLWRESFPAVDKAHFSDFVLRAQDGLHPEVAIMIENVLETNGPKVKLPKQPGKSEDQPLNLTLIPSYTTPQGRSKLRVVLRAFGCWRPHLGYNPIMAALAAQIMAVTGSEKVTFQILVSIYKKYRLKDYFEGEQEKQEERKVEDAEALWRSAQVQWPNLVYAFSRYPSGEGIFKDCVKSLLSTLLTDTHRPEKQPFEWHVRLLHHVLLPVGDYSPADPRAQLRHVVMQIMARYLHAFLKCEDEHQLENAATEVTRYVHVDVLLVTLLAKRLSAPKVYLAPSLVGGSVVGALSCDVASHFLPPEAPILVGIAAAAAGTAACLFGSTQLSVEQIADENRELMTDAHESRDEEAKLDLFGSCVVA